MFDRTHADEVLFRVAVAAFTYQPDKHLTEPGYTIDEDLDWCLAPLATLPDEDQANMRDRIRALITDPTGDRRAFIDHLYTLVNKPA